MKIRKRYLLLGIVLCLTIGPAGLASILALLKLTGTLEAVAQSPETPTPDPVD
jgi:hypothetical protein